MFATLSSKNVGANLRRLIKESKYRTQENFAEACHTSPRNLRRWIKQGVKDIDIIDDLAKALDVDPMALLK